MIRSHDKRTILMVDDDPDDFFLVRNAFKATGLRGEVQQVTGGEEMLDYLYRRGKFKDLEEPPVPCVILLDLNMPGKNGWEVLGEIKRNPCYRRIPIVVFTTSGEEEDISGSYELGASSYISKPPTFEALVEVMKTLGEYWLKVVSLPMQSFI